ncbi:unnamed protein product [Meloidogyne enterolobii]|uniref:Uncharacterized protein n=1 Tax=Meloidogyne enterolobii TaxID=390850 RepID=A0ACB0YHQ3_MELEN
MDCSFLRLAPIKVEIVRFEPLAVIFRNVIGDEEIEIMQNIALKRLMIARVQNAATGEAMLSKYRISKKFGLKY